MKSYIKISLLILCIIFSGCALTNSVKKINYKPNINVVNKINGENESIKIEKVIDERGYENPKIIFHKKNALNQKASGKFLAEEPISELISRGLKKGLVEKGIIMETENPDLTLKSTLQELDYEAIMGLTTMDVIPTMKVKFQLIENENGRIVWSDILEGKANIKGLKVEKIVSLVIDDLVSKLIENPQFLESMK